MTRLKMTTAALLACGSLAVGAGLLAQQTGAGGAAQKVGVATKDTSPIAPAVRSLIEARIATARQVYEEQLQQNQGSILQLSDDTSTWSRHWMEDQLRLKPGPAERLAAIQDHLERAKRVEQIVDAYAREGRGRFVDALKTRYFRLEAEQMLAEAKALYPDVPLPVPKRVGERREPIPPPPPPPPG